MNIKKYRWAIFIRLLNDSMCSMISFKLETNDKLLYSKNDSDRNSSNNLLL